MTVLSTQEIPLHLKSLPNWSKRARTIHRTFEFNEFLDGIAFVNRIAKRTQKLNHHPDIDIRFNNVTLQLTTHGAGGLTGKDFVLARQCDEDFSKLAGS